MKWFIPGNVPSSKNGRRWTGKYFISSKAVMKYRKDTRALYKKLRNSFLKTYNKYEEPVTISFRFVRGTKHKFDYLNPAQTVQDDMVEHEWLEDDNCTFIIPAFKPFHYDKTKPGVYIEIESNGNRKKENTVKHKAKLRVDVL